MPNLYETYGQIGIDEKTFALHDFGQISLIPTLVNFTTLFLGVFQVTMITLQLQK